MAVKNQNTVKRLSLINVDKYAPPEITTDEKLPQTIGFFPLAEKPPANCLAIATSIMEKAKKLPM